MASHYIKSPMGHDVQVSIEDHSYGDGQDACTPYGTLHVHAATCKCTYTVCAVEGGSIENQSYGNSTCTESCQRNTVSFTQCVYMHKSVGV